MNEDGRSITQSDLKALGLSEYLIREICNNLPFTRMKSGAREYKRSDLRESIAKKLSQPKTQPATTERLQVALKLLGDKSNVIEVDFLRNLTPEQRIDFLKNYREGLKTKGETLLKNVDELLKEAKQLL